MSTFNGNASVKNGAEPTTSSAFPLTSETKRIDASLSQINVNAVVDKHVWTKEESEMLLDMYEANRESFKSPGVRKIGVWANIAEVINLKFGTEFSAQQCHQKLRNFKNDFHKVMMLEKKDCRHFQRLHRLFLQSATKPSQSPAALKRKLTQLAGSKPCNTSGQPNQKKPCASYSDSTTSEILSGLYPSKKKTMASTNQFTENISIERKKSVTANHHEGVKVFPSKVLYQEQHIIPFPSSSATYPMKPSSYHVHSIQPSTSKRPPTSSFSLAKTVAPASNLIESVVSSLKANQQIKQKDKPIIDLSHDSSQEIVLEKPDTDKILNNGESVKGENGLPVPAYYYSNTDPTRIIMGQGQDNFVERNPTQDQTISQASSQNNSIDKSIKKTPLEVLKTLLDTAGKRKSRKSSSNDEKNGCITENGHNSRTDLTEQSTAGDISKLVESIEKWRNDSLEREKARIIREKARDNRIEEMHQENVKLTSRFIEIFETLLDKINSSS